MIRHLLVALMLSIAIVGCSERYTGSIQKAPTLLDERPAVPSEQQVIADLRDQFGQNISTEIIFESETIEAHVFIVSIEQVWFKVAYYLVDGDWICITEQID